MDKDKIEDDLINALENLMTLYKKAYKDTGDETYYLKFKYQQRKIKFLKLGGKLSDWL